MTRPAPPGPSAPEPGDAARGDRAAARAAPSPEAGAGDFRLSRRGLIAGSGLAAAATLVAGLRAGTSPADAAAAPAVGSGSAVGPSPAGMRGEAGATVPFFGLHQAGVITPQPPYLAFAAYDLVDADPASFAELMAAWTSAAARLAAGRPLEGPSRVFGPPPDSGETAGVGPSRLTLTVGFGPSLFERLGLASHRPAALVDLPAFPGDELDPARTGGDLCLQACAEDPGVAFHAVRNLTRLGRDAVSLRYVQIGSGSTTRAAPGAVPPRNLLGFHDGTDNPDPADPAAMRGVVWVGRGPDQPWMAGGTYLVARRIRIHLEAWDHSTIAEQEHTVGRVKATGAPLGGRRLDDPPALGALGANGQPLIPNDAHIRQASPALNGGATLLRRGFSFVDGLDPASGELDAGLFFICFQRDPGRQFVTVQQRLAANDALASYLVHTGSGLFACPPGVQPGEPWGSGLLRAAGLRA